MKIFLYICISLFACENSLASTFTCGMALGYAPFQYVEKGEKQGIDAEIVAAFNEVGPHKINLIADKWDNLVSELYHIKGIDCLVGMEKSASRDKIFKFSTNIYKRSSSLVLLEGNSNTALESLAGKVVCGDKDSILEYELVNLSKIPIRLMYMETKEKCMKALESGIVEAAIMPKRVAAHLSKKFKLKTKVILESKKPIDVAIAFKKKDPVNLKEFNNQLRKLIQSTKFKDIFKSYN